MDGYVSPFLLPTDRKQPKCNNPKDAARYPGMHPKAGEPGVNRSLWGDECPVHGKTARENKRENLHWEQWYEFREAYAALESGPFTSPEAFEQAQTDMMNRMLGYVTLENPPDRPADIEVKLNLMLPVILFAAFAGAAMLIICVISLLV